MGALFALSFPGLAVLLVALVALERLGLWFAGHSWVPWRRRTGMPVSAAALDVFSGITEPGQRIDRDELHAKMLMRDDDEEGAPPLTRVDLDAGTVWLRPPGSDPA
ncbi:MAG TPA: DUF6191 domain-containing protein [Pseudonocardiaceae bacterium]|nr:DUF6191 domain-containing protein [Pseudonocardiaceae bacterium]